MVSPLDQFEAYKPVTKRTRPELDWSPQPRVFWIVPELLHSDAYRDLTKIESDLLLFIYSRRSYPMAKGKKKNPRDYWSPLNGHEMTIPHIAVKEFFSRMKAPPPVPSTITRAVINLMRVSFLEPVAIGGRGKGDMSKYRLIHDWRVWRKGDVEVHTKAGMCKGKGFCLPGSGVFCPARKLEKGCELA